MFLISVADCCGGHFACCPGEQDLTYFFIMSYLYHSSLHIKKGQWRSLQKTLCVFSVPRKVLLQEASREA